MFATATAWGRLNVGLGAAVFALVFALRSGSRGAAVVLLVLHCRSTVGAVVQESLLGVLIHVALPWLSWRAVAATSALARIGARDDARSAAAV